MSKAPSPLLGYNNNVRHKNKIFHIQTEDSGVKYGHIITHLFMDGGRILKSVKTAYTEYLGTEKMADVVREMMKQQHKAMFIALRDGKFDHLVEGTADISQQTKALSQQAAALVAAQAPAAPAAAPPVPPGPPAPVPAAPPGADATQKMAPMPAMFPTPPPQPITISVAKQAPPGVGAFGRAPTPLVGVSPAHAAPRAIPPPAPTPDASAADDPSPMTERNPNELTLDIDALERAAAAAETSSPVFKPASDLPPPPTNLFREKTATGKYRTLPPGAPPSGTSGSSPPGTLAAPAAPTPAPHPAIAPEKRAPAAASPAAANAKRYAPTRPASIFGQSRPQQGKAVFGEDLISDKSLDEVILSYLADDLDPPAKK